MQKEVKTREAAFMRDKSDPSLGVQGEQSSFKMQ
jgi:hypothetical protein